MKYRVLDLLCSVPDGAQLRIAKVTKSVPAKFDGPAPEPRCRRFCGFRNCAVQGPPSSSECRGCYTDEIIEGELISDSGKCFPIIDGIPRLLSDSAAEFVSKNKESFSLEWKYFQFGERNWGQDIEERKSLFLNAFGATPAEFRNRILFDAGCGSGLLSMEVAKSYGLEVVAMDLATGIEQANRANRNPYVHFVQGSVLEPVLKQSRADYVYCAGVLVALPDSREGFNALTKCVKPGGRYFIWLYHPLERHRQTGDYVRTAFYNWLRYRLTSHLPIRIQELFYLSLLPFYYLKRGIYNRFRTQKDDLTWREKMQGFVDHLSPIYMNRHTEAEAFEWFNARGFENVTISYNEQYGFGIRGDRPAAALPSAAPAQPAVV